MISLLYELLNVTAADMIGKMNMYTGGRYGVSHQCELLNVRINWMTGKMTLYTGGSYEVSRQCELSYEFSDYIN